MTKNICVEAPKAQATFRRWLERGDAIGVFTNQDLSSQVAGHQVFIPLDAEDAVAANLGKMQAPDGPHGLGWRYRLTAIERSLAAFTFVTTGLSQTCVEDRGDAGTYRCVCGNTYDASPCGEADAVVGDASKARHPCCPTCGLHDGPAQAPAP